ncbi:DUF805 domain-containing protein [Methylobacterium sp. BTF04]|uniref:DUF805 domain-containing protein n=1 Tax=Methylobacterium sp. BTF04 TaxID=2708300 RepID=UPI0013D5A25C|nr:DUF805 domain-containing protein [Methylobacterium sp. BTF04]NEU10859.1 DUF805 domain-containing protein [Methylobacterium sp. BTF04]
MRGAALSRIRRAFDPRGRLSAHAYRLHFVRSVLAFAGLVCLAIWLAALDFRLFGILAFAGNLIVLAVLGARTARRLHDRNRSAAWLGVYALVYAASFAPIETAADRHPVVVIVGVLVILGFLSWFFVETFLRQGTPGLNRFGAEPDS